MSLPHLLLVDDSEAVLTYEQAALSALYALSSASNGVEALKKARLVRPDAILLDLSMPEMDGDAVLAELQSDLDLADVPVIIISSEHGRAEACLRAGASAYLPKPLQAAELRAVVARTLEEAQRIGRQGSLAVLTMIAGGLELAVPLECVHQVLPQLPTKPLPFGPPYLREVFEFGDEPVCVLDLPQALGTEHTNPLQDRRLVVIEHERRLLALSVDSVRDPEEFAARDVIPRERLAGTEHGLLPRVLRAVVRREGGVLAVVDPTTLVSAELLRDLAASLAMAVDSIGASP